MSSLAPNQFSEFFFSIYGYDPFPWQQRVAARVCNPERNWPKAIALPTAAGKTGCIDIAVFALACQAKLGPARTAPRRIFFVVDRRIVVDQACQHAKDLAAALRNAKAGIVKSVADQLRSLSDSDYPLDVYAMRGGMYRDSGWAASPLQATVIASTVDQVGSRLLFRGYGVSDSAKPIHAGLVGNDALILLDEAHCARPFEQTCSSVERYRVWGGVAQQPFRQVSITATPSVVEDVERDDNEDQNHPVLGRRINAGKPTSLIVAEKAKGKNWKNWGPQLVNEFAKQALSLMGNDLGQDQKGVSHFVKAVGIIVNRVATARELAQTLKGDPKNTAEVILLTGRMRPVDRDAILEQLKPLFSNSQAEIPKQVYVVATQCLEVGADLDFHALVTECASLDALRQRFGRLNRVAARPSSKSVIVIRGDQITDTSEDPVYGGSLANTWQWLVSKSNGNVIDLGVSSVRDLIDGVDLAPLNAPSLDAPVLFPAHLDCWVQTHPIPSPDPDPAVFMHGPQAGSPDVQVVFRGDLGADSKKWVEIVKLCPPSSAEAVSVPIHVFRKWFSGCATHDETSDLEGIVPVENETPQAGVQRVLRWSGPQNSEVVSDASSIRPGDTLVVRVDDDADALDGMSVLGDFPTRIPTDCGDEAFQRARDRAILRLPDVTWDPDSEEFESLVTSKIEELAVEDPSDWKKRAVNSLKSSKNRSIVEHPLMGCVVTGKQRLKEFDPSLLEEDDSSDSPSSRHVTLVEHSCGVAEKARRFSVGCGLDVDLFSFAGYFHDLGKLDPRFQALLKGRSPRTVGGEAWAKSGSFGCGDPDVHQYPKGARHELLSVALLESHTNDDLLLHLIATHHGSARPFANSVTENAAAQSPFSAELLGSNFKADTCAQRIAEWNATLANRFWRVVRKYGWWGSAFQEAVFRLADHAQSQLEQITSKAIEGIPDVPTRSFHSSNGAELWTIELSGIDGTNPLGFLTALGTLRLSDQLFPGTPRLRWIMKETWIPVLTLPMNVSKDVFVERVFSKVHRAVSAESMTYTENCHKEYRKIKKEADKALEEIKRRQLRGDERSRAIEAFVNPIRIREQAARARWLVALESSAPAAYLSLGKALSVSSDEFRDFASRMAQRLFEKGVSGRDEADFVSGYSCEVYQGASGRVIPTKFQLINGSGHQFFLETIGMLMEAVTLEKLENALFNRWTYSDERLSLRWDPIDDRRYAYQADDPSSEAARTEHGANLLAAFAIPFFPCVPSSGGIVTTGFCSTDRDDFWTWPIWRVPLSFDTVRSLVATRVSIDTNVRIASTCLGPELQYFQVKKVEVGKAPLSKFNLTYAVRVT